jgi:glycosyltransferase involved in cell wall biosynthesis
MNVLMISGDPKLLEEGSSAHARLDLQRSAVDTLTVFVWPQVHTKWQIWKEARRNHYDVITSQDPFWRGLFALKLGRLTRTPVNIQVHADLSGQSPLKRFIARWVLGRANSIRVVSERLAKEVRATHPTALITVLPVFVDLAPFRAVAREPQVSPKVILWIGRFEKEKDPDLVVEVFKQMHDANPDTELVMLGAGSREAILHKQSEGLPVTFPGWQDPKPYLARASVVLSTSPSESWGASIVEALATGVPVVSRDVGIAKEAGAVVVEKADLAQALIRVLKSGEMGVLKLDLLGREEWAQKWRKSLIKAR